jgi:hypothetical protein
MDVYDLLVKLYYFAGSISVPDAGWEKHSCHPNPLPKHGMTAVEVKLFS